MCLCPVTIKNPRLDYRPSLDSPFLAVPCGHCYECNQQRAFDLEIRAVSEYNRVKDAGGIVFNYTLTYDEEHCPRYLGLRVLCRRDMQLFKKRLKSLLGDDGDKIHIFYVGEYGSRNTKRCHFHILIYCDILFSPFDFANYVSKAWQQGYIGFPEMLVDGKPVMNVYTAEVRGVQALSYCVKYVSKCSQYYNYVASYFKDWLANHGIPQTIIEDGQEKPNKDFYDFEFPDDDRFRFRKDGSLDFYYICKYFSKCYRCPNNFGMAQKDYLNSDYEYVSNVKRGQKLVIYPMSHYLKQKMFNIYCVIDKNHKISHKNKLWLDYALKKYPIFAQNYENKILSNKNTKLYFSDYDTVKDSISCLANYADVALRDFFLYRLVYTSPYLSNLSVPEVLRIRQSRVNVYNSCYSMDVDFLLIPSMIKYYEFVLNQVVSEIKYIEYKKSIDRYNDYQYIKSLLSNRGLSPKVKYYMSYQQFINDV